MHALHQTLLPSSSIHHSLFLPNFTPSTIYPPPKQAQALDAPDVKVVGNLVVAGAEVLRVFEIREELVPIIHQKLESDGANGDGTNGDVQMEELGDGFFDEGHADRAPLKFEARRKLHLLAQHELHGTVTGLAPLRTIESSVDGLDRLIVSFKDAKMALLEWSRGVIATVSLHTYERCPQMNTGDLQNYVPILRTDPLSRMAVLVLPEDSLAVLPVVQEQSELDPISEGFTRDAPYAPSFVLSLSDVSSTIKNIQDLLFLPGFHSTTLALLFSPAYTWSGRYHSVKDNFCLEIRTFDISSGGGSYPLLTSVKGLPSDCLYLVACPPELGGVVVVTSTGLVHMDQSGRVIGTRVNGWWNLVTTLKSSSQYESRKLALEGSRAVFATPHDMLLILQNGDVHQVRFVMEGRNVGEIEVQERSCAVPPPSSVVQAGEGTVFVGCAEGDSWLAKVEIVREVIKQDEKEEPKEEMEVDWDEDLYGDINDPSLDAKNGSKQEYGPAQISLRPYDILTGVGKILDIEFGIAATDQGLRTYPQLVAISGGSRNSTFNVFRRGIPITKRRRFNELHNAEGVWFLPIDRPAGQKLRDIPDAERATILLSSENTATRVFALSNKPTPQQINRLEGKTLAAAPFFQRTCIVHVSPYEVSLMDNNGKVIQNVCPRSAKPAIVSASISDPFVVIRRVDDTVSFFVGDTAARSLSEASLVSEGEEAPLCQTAEVFSDTTGVYRTFEPSTTSTDPTQAVPHTFAKANGADGLAPRTRQSQLTQQQIKRLQDQEPAITTDAPTMETAINPTHGTQWLALATRSGELQIRALPDLQIVLQSERLASSAPSFTDDLSEGSVRETMEHKEEGEEEDDVKQMVFCPVGKGSLRPHLLVLHHSGRLNAYETQPRFTVDASSHSRRSLAVRFTKVHTQLLPISGGVGTSTEARLQYNIVPFENIEGLTGAFITGLKPQWIISSDAHPLRAYALKQAAMAFGKTTHLGGKGEYFIRIVDGSFICYLPPTLNTDFVIPCDRYQMERPYTNIVFDPTSAHYVGAASVEVPFQAYDEEGEIQLGPQGENLIPPTNQRSTLELFSQGSDPWRVIDGYEFDQNEEVMSMESVTLESPGAPGGYRDFIAVGTGFNFGEDRATRGNTYIFEVLETVGPQGGSANVSGWKLRLRTKDPARHPVNAVSNINGFLLNTNGPKLYVKGLDDDQQLMGLAFLDIQLYATTLKVFKNFILIGDLCKSFWFVSLQEEPYKFTTISKDLQGVSVVTTDFLVHDGQVTFISSDRNGDMRMLDFDPTDPDSLNGERLMLKTEFHAGSPATVSKVIARRRAGQEESKTAGKRKETQEDYAPQTQIIYATADGALTTVVSVKEARFRRLQLVSDQLVRNAQHVAGLNPRAFRTVRNDLLPRPLTKGILDGQLLNHFALQPIGRQREMMRQIGTDAVTVASDLQALGGFW